MTAIETSFYVVGGTLHRDAPSYVRRRADDELYNGLSQGQFCYVLTSRQMGKSSLMVRTAMRLRTEGATVIVLDLTAIGQNLTAEQWYEGLLNLAGQQLHLEDWLEEFWLAHPRLGPLQRWMRALSEVVLRHCSGPVIVFVDEIDAVRSLPFSTDEFFAGIREFYNARTEDAALQRLTFCLLGVATPSDLIRDTRTTPFNIGRRIELNDFTIAEAAPLAAGFAHDERRGRKLLQRIIHWTGGHPYLTQRLCQTVADAGDVRGVERIDELCAELFFTSRARERDDNLHFVRERLLRSEVELVSLLELYAKVRRGQLVPDDDADPRIAVLRLSGIVRVEDSRLTVRNRIYAHVFDRDWVLANVPNAERQRQRRAYRRGVLRATTMAAVIIILLAASWLVTHRALKNNRRVLYVAQMNLAQQAWEQGNIERVLELLDETRAETDLRGFEWDYFQQLCHSDLQTFANNSEVWAAAFSPDGRLLAAGDSNGVVRIWNVERRRELFTLRRHTAQVNALAFFPDGQTLVTGSDDKTLRLWDTITGAERALLGTHEDAVRAISIHAPSGLLISASEDGAVKLWEPQTRRLLTTLNEESSPISTMALSPNGGILALGSAVGTVEFWDVARQLELTASPRQQRASRIRALAFAPHGQLLAAGDEDGYVALWDVRQRRELASFKPETKAVLTLAFAPDNRMLAVAGEDKVVRLWDVVKGQERAMWKGHLSLIHTIAFAPDGRALVSGSQDHSVRLWNISQPQAGATFDLQAAEIRALAFAPDSKLLAIGADEVVQLFDPARPEERVTIPAHAGYLSALTFAARGQRLVTASEDETLKLWELGAQGNSRTLLNNAGELHAVALSPDGRLLAAGGQQKTVWLFDALSGTQLAALPAEVEVIRALAFAPDGKMLAVSTAGGLVRFWDVARRRALAALKVHQQPVPINAIAFAPDGKTLATASSDGITRLWETPSGALQLLLKGHAAAVLALAFTPDGRRLATSSEDKTVKLWEVEKGLELTTFKAHTGAVKTIAFAPDGRTLASGGHDGTVRLWHTAR